MARPSTVLAVVLVHGLAAGAALAQVTVRPGNLGPWQEQNAACTGVNSGSTGFQNGPATPPLGSGSGQLTVGANSDSLNAFALTGVNGVFLNQLTELRYGTYVQTDGSGGSKAPYLVLDLDYTQDGLFDDQIFFEPQYQGGLATGTWQSWNALTGGWWSPNGTAGTSPGNTQQLSAFIAAQPDAQIVDTVLGEGGLRVSSGCLGTGWASFDGAFDAVVVGVNDKSTTYDFEASLPAITIDDLSQAEGTGGGTTSFDVTLHLSELTSDVVSVDFDVVLGTATSPGDFAATSGTVFFAPQTDTTTISVQVVADAAQEPDETFFVDLSNPQLATLGDDQATGTIQNDDLGQVDADLAIVKQGPAAVDGGDPVNYTITVTNNGPADASDVVVDDTIPAGTTFVSATPSQGSCNAASPVVCHLGQILAGNGASIALVVTAPNATVQVSNTATVSNSPETDPTAPNNSSSWPTDVSNDADLSIVKLGPGAANAGDPINYTITVTNNGPAKASNVVVNDTIPPGTTFVSATPSQGTCNAASPVVCQLGQILAGNNASIALVVNAPNVNGNITNIAAVTNSPQTDPTPANNSSSVPTAISGGLSVVDVPTASGWGLLALAAALAALGLRRLR